MESTLQPLAKTERWEAPGNVEHTMGQLMSVLDAHGWKVTQQDASYLEAHRGSRPALRLLGVLLQPGRSRLPMKLHISIGAAERGAVVDVSIESDEGWYPFQLHKLVRAYEADFAGLLEALKANTIRTA